MASRNPYEKYIKLILKKSSRIYSQREGETVYICNEMSVVKLPLIYYDMYIRPVSGAFIALEDGDRAVLEGESLISQINASAADIKTLFDRAKAENPLRATRFLVELPNGKRKTTARLFKSSDALIAADNEYLSAATDFCGELCSNGRATDMLKCDSDYSGFMICPIRIPESVYDDLLN